MATSKTVLIIGAGPAGLTAALELLRCSQCKVVVFEALDDVGGISRTIEHNGNRMDIGGHRFFSKSDWVMGWWRELMPVAPEKAGDGTSVVPDADRHMLIRNRLSRIYFLRKFFDYPISLSLATMTKLGPWRILTIGMSYLRARLFRRIPERNLEDFFINRFGSVLYRIFFKDYTEKVWGVPCREISAEWGAQRIKGLSVTKAIWHALRKLARPPAAGVEQKAVSTSLIERFLYPKHGPGQMWQCVAEEIRRRGGLIHMNQRVLRVHRDGTRITGLDTQGRDGEIRSWNGDWCISTMAIRDLVQAMEPAPPDDVVAVANGLMYRDFITMGVLLRKLQPTRDSRPPLNLLPDTWIYIQEPDVKIGRLQIFNNWSPALVHDKTTVWMGLEYFCQEGDELWRMSDEEFSRFAIDELARIDLIDPADVMDWKVVRVAKAYPAYFGSYERFPVIRRFVDEFDNLFLVGRNGMHRYNNQDHSMITAKLAVEAILGESSSKAAIWNVNVDDEYHEEQQPGA